MNTPRRFIAAAGLPATILSVFLAGISPAPGAPAPASVRLELTGTEWSHYGDCNLVLRLTNNSAATITWTGYSDLPLFKRRTGRPWGWHTGKVIADCGVGLGDHRLEPGSSKTFSLHVPENRYWRIGVPYGVAEETAYRNTAWSPALPSWNQDWLDTRGLDPANFVQAKMTPSPTRGGDTAFELKNISQQTLYYAGYAKDAPYEKGPLFLMQERRRGAWKDDRRAWGGLGLAWRKIPPGGTLKFNLSAWSDDTLRRVGMRVYLTPTPRSFTDACRAVWWPVLPKEK